MTIRLKRIQFGEEHFIRQILTGVKTVTLYPADEYALPWGDYSSGGWENGDQVEVYDAAGILRGVIDIMRVYPISFGEAATTLWQEEGYHSATGFRQDYALAWPEADDDLKLIAMHFHLREQITQNT